MLFHQTVPLIHDDDPFIKNSQCEPIHHRQNAKKSCLREKFSNRIVGLQYWL